MERNPATAYQDLAGKLTFWPFFSPFHIPLVPPTGQAWSGPKGRTAHSFSELTFPGRSAGKRSDPKVKWEYPVRYLQNHDFFFFFNTSLSSSTFHIPFYLILYRLKGKYRAVCMSAWMCTHLCVLTDTRTQRCKEGWVIWVDVNTAASYNAGLGNRSH